MKQYNNENAIIALTSWKGRIDTLSITLFSLLKQCPGFHIIVTLSEEEFPNKELDLPNDLIQIIDNNLIEIVWVYHNYKSFKKILFAMEKYPDVPIISADDGCIYVTNYAQMLYNIWLTDQKSIISLLTFKSRGIICGAGGNGIIFPPNCFKDIGINILEHEYEELLKNPNDDRFIGCLAHCMSIPWYGLDMVVKDIKKNIKIFIDFDKNVGLTANREYIAGQNSIFLNIIKKYIK